MNLKQTFSIVFVLLLGMTASAQDYELVWSDEFDTNTLGINWNVEATNSPYNNELEAYTTRPENVTVADGNLVLTARRENYGGKSFTSGRVNSEHKVSFAHGKIEARIKLPKLANGLWPAFWMMGEDFDSVDWPKCGEIDIMEMGMKDALANGSADRTVAGTIHWADALYISCRKTYFIPSFLILRHEIISSSHLKGVLNCKFILATTASIPLLCISAKLNPHSFKNRCLVCSV